MKSKSEILVTGGCGFIGGHLVDKITEMYPACKIVVVDDLRTPGNHRVDGVTYIERSVQDSVKDFDMNFRFD